MHRRSSRRGAVQPAMTRLNMVLALVLVASSLYLVRTAYESRHLYAELDRARTAAARLDTEFKRLEAERQAQATNLRIATPAVTVYVNDPAPIVAPAGGRP
jgi:cell division protein FtsL